jgi:hypothetical protein
MSKIIKEKFEIFYILFFLGSFIHKLSQCIIYREHLNEKYRIIIHQPNQKLRSNLNKILI